MATPDLHRTAATFATMLAFHCVRNSSLEDLHAGVFPSSKTGDYTDVKVVSPYGEIAWNRVYTLPDFVRFAHRPHVLAGVACQECHGPVETMDRIVPVQDINMGFCITCHTERHVSKDCSVCHY